MQANLIPKAKRFLVIDQGSRQGGRMKKTEFEDIMTFSLWISRQPRRMKILKNINKSHFCLYHNTFVCRPNFQFKLLVLVYTLYLCFPQNEASKYDTCQDLKVLVGQAAGTQGCKNLYQKVALEINMSSKSLGSAALYHDHSRAVTKSRYTISRNTKFYGNPTRTLRNLLVKISLNFVE